MRPTERDPGAEALRLRALRDLEIMDTEAEPDFDDLTTIAAQVSGLPIALVTFVDADRQWFKSRVGLETREAPRDHAICDHALDLEGPLIIEDSTADPRFHDNPLVTGEPGIRFYTGFPLRVEPGLAVGTLCVIDRRPRRLDPGKLETLSVVARITEDRLRQRRDRMRLIEGRENLRRIVDMVPGLLFVRDADGVIVLANENFAEAYGVTCLQAEGSLHSELHPDPSELDALLELDAVRMKGPGACLRKRMSFTGARGEVRLLDFVAVPYTPAGAEVPATLFLGIDLSARLRTEEQLAETERRLLQAQKMEAVGRLTGGVAHDFNNLLSVVLGYSSLLLEDLAEGHPAREDVRYIHEAAERGACLIRQLLAFSRREAVASKVVCLSEVVAGMEKLVKRILGEDLEVRWEPGGGDISVRADTGQLEQVLMNLAVNARDAMPEGGELGVRVSRWREELGRETSTGALDPGDYACLEVRDTGVGMDGETLEKIFEPFFTTKPPEKGSGLGLATVYGIVQQAGGRIDVESAPGEGATVRVLLPEVPPDDSAATLQEEEKDARTPRGARILVVEDEPMIRELATRVLSGRGLDVETAENGRAALALVEGASHPYDLVLTDVVMPQMSGRELADHLRRVAPGTRVLFMTGYTDDAALRQGVENAQVELIRKPFSPDQLAEKVWEVLAASPTLTAIEGSSLGDDDAGDTRGAGAP